VSDSTSPGRRIVYSIPAVIAAVAIAWALALPRWECVSGFDNETCADRIYVKWTISVAGIALAVIALASSWSCGVSSERGPLVPGRTMYVFVG
jgi:hypothetical protein